MKPIEKAIGYSFKDPALLKTALTHTSYANEGKRRMQSNQRLEFLGDSVLGIVVADYLYETMAKLPEGELTRRRAALVCEPALAAFAAEIKLGHHLLLGHGEETHGGRQRPSILADAFEALIAAIYLDGGIEAARGFILPFIKTPDAGAGEDFKTRLQEVIQQNPDGKLNYMVANEEGPDHEKCFTVDVYLESKRIGTGSGQSKKAAEQQAARQALEIMGLPV